MQKQTLEKANATSHTQNSAEETHNKNSTLATTKKIEGSPFCIVYKEDIGHFLALGDYRLTEPMKTEEEVLEYSINNNWNLITTLVAAIVDKYNKIKEKEKEIETAMQQLDDKNSPTRLGKKISTDDRMTQAGL